MNQAKAKLFICHHPDQILLYKNLVQIIKKHDQKTMIILFKVNHPYFLKFNFAPYNQYFDKIIEFDFINYKKNFWRGYLEIFNFQKKLKKTMANLSANFGTIDLFITDSAWLPVNILLYNLARQKNIKNITKLAMAQLESPQTKKDIPKTFLCSLYSLPFKCYKIKVISNLTGKFQGFAYTDRVAGNIVRIISPFLKTLNNPNGGKENILPYPVITKHSKGTKKDMVIIFGDANIVQCYSEYLPGYETFVKKMTSFFEVLENKYSNYKLYYKPHPTDNDRIMPGINIQRYNLFDNTTNAEMIFDKYHQKIKAVYTFSSTSIMPASFFAIPSYTFYRYLFNPPGVELLDNIFNQDNIKSQFIFHLSNLSEIGKIDNLKCPDLDSEKSGKLFRKILNV